MLGESPMKAQIVYLLFSVLFVIFSKREFFLLGRLPFFRSSSISSFYLPKRDSKTDPSELWPHFLGRTLHPNRIVIETEFGHFSNHQRSREVYCSFLQFPKFLQFILSSTLLFTSTGHLCCLLLLFRLLDSSIDTHHPAGSHLQIADLLREPPHHGRNTQQAPNRT